MKKNKIIFLGGSILLIILIFGLGYWSFNREIKVVFDKCVDGDTAWFLVNDKRVKVRFLGVDSPEVDAYYGEMVSRYTCNLLNNTEEITLEYEENSDRYDKYDRLLAWVFVDGINMSELLVANGYAEVKYIYGDYKYTDDLCRAQKEAYAIKLAIWNNGVKDKDYHENYCNKLLEK